MDMPERLRALGVEVDNLRAALSWAFSVEGDAKIGVELAAACPSSDNLRLIRHFEKGGSGSSGVRV
jgi:hypothetical protein